MSKTVIYPLMEEKGVATADYIFRNTLGNNYTVHKHQKDLRLNLAPHVCKSTIYQGKLYDMGMGQISVQEK